MMLKLLWITTLYYPFPYLNSIPTQSFVEPKFTKVLIINKFNDELLIMIVMMIMVMFQITYSRRNFSLQGGDWTCRHLDDKHKLS